LGGAAAGGLIAGGAISAISNCFAVVDFLLISLFVIISRALLQTYGARNG